MHIEIKIRCRILNSLCSCLKSPLLFSFRLQNPWSYSEEISLKIFQYFIHRDDEMKYFSYMRLWNQTLFYSIKPLNMNFKILFSCILFNAFVTFFTYPLMFDFFRRFWSSYNLITQSLTAFENFKDFQNMFNILKIRFTVNYFLNLVRKMKYFCFILLWNETYFFVLNNAIEHDS